MKNVNEENSDFFALSGVILKTVPLFVGDRCIFSMSHFSKIRFRVVRLYEALNKLPCMNMLYSPYMARSIFIHGDHKLWVIVVNEL